MIFSKRLKVSEQAEDWCGSKNIPITSFNLLTALDDLGYLRDVVECESCAWNASHTGFKFCPDCGASLATKRQSKV